jgi:hypothetical protein
VETPSSCSRHPRRAPPSLKRSFSRLSTKHIASARRFSFIPIPERSCGPHCAAASTASLTPLHAPAHGN